MFSLFTRRRSQGVLSFVHLTSDILFDGILTDGSFSIPSTPSYFRASYSYRCVYIYTTSVRVALL